MLSYLFLSKFNSPNMFQVLFPIKGCSCCLAVASDAGTVASGGYSEPVTVQKRSEKYLSSDHLRLFFFKKIDTVLRS